MASEWLRNLRHCYDKRKEDKLACECRFRRCEDKGDETAWITLLMFARRKTADVNNVAENVDENYKTRGFDIRLSTPVTGAETGFFGDLFRCEDFECGDQILCDNELYELGDGFGGPVAEELSMAMEYGSGDNNCGAIRLTGVYCGVYEGG